MEHAARWVALVAILASAGCGGPSATDGGASGIDAGADASGIDAGADTSGIDARADAPRSDAPGLDAWTDGGRTDAGPVVDDDRDDDGVPDTLDALPDDPLEWADSDSDGVGNLADTDEDGDGVLDTSDALPFDPGGSAIPTPPIVPSALPSGAPALGALPVRLVITLGGAAGDAAHVALGAGLATGVTLVVEGTGARTLDVLALESSVVLFPQRERSSARRREISFAPETADVVLGLDAAGRAGGARDFTVTIVADADLDGLDDARELALGMRPFDPDPDADGLDDAEELVAAPDPDGDGVPAFLDDDSDGDGIADRDEPAVDHDGDALPAFVDPDADGDGTGDLGADPADDLDADGLSDFLDVDDDGDGLRDAVDAAPRVPLSVDLDPRTGVVVSALATVLGADVAPGAIVPGQTLVVSGQNLDGPGTLVAIFGASGPTPLSVVPTSVAATELRVLAPSGATSPVRIVRDATASEPMSATVVDLAEAEPLLFEQPTATTWPAPLRGRNLERIYRLHLGDRRLAPDFSTGVPAIQAEGSGLLRVESLDGTSNEVPLRMSMPGVTVSVALPSGSTLDPSTFVVSGALEDAPDSGGSATFAPPLASAGQGGELISAISVDGLGAGHDCMALAAYAIDGFAGGIDATTTATALALVHTSGLSRVDRTAAETLRGRFAALPETAALATHIDARLAADDRCPLDAPDAAMRDAIVALAVAAEADLSAGLTDGTLRAPGPSTFVAPRLPLRVATITPEQYDIAVLQTAGTENVEVENDSSLNLSARIETAPEGRVLVPHVGGYFDEHVIGGQSGVLTLYRASTSSFDQPRARDALVEVITPGVLAPFPSDAARRETQQLLALRTAVEGFVLPAIDATVGGLGPRQEAVLHLILQQGYLGVLDARMAYDAHDLPGFVSAVLGIVLRDLDGIGPITQGLAQLLGGAVVARVSRRLAARLVPILGQIATIADVAGTTAGLTNMGKLIVDMATTPGVLRYDVQFGFAIDRVEPLVVERAYRPAQVTLHGASFWGLDLGRRVRPRVRVRDGGSGAERTYDVAQISLDGTELTVVVPGDFMATAVGPLFFAVDRAGERMEHPVGVAVEQTLRLASTAPDPIGPGQRMLLSGAGFGPDPRRVRVWFYGVDGSGTEVQLRGRVVEHTRTELAVITPSGLAADRSWEVEVDVTEPSGALATSNRLALNVRCADLAGTVWDLTATFDLCTTPRRSHFLVVFDRFIHPLNPSVRTGAVLLESGNPASDGRAAFAVTSSCGPDNRLYLVGDDASVGVIGADFFPHSTHATEVVVADRRYPTVGSLSPDGRSFRWFSSYLGGCSGALGFPLVPDRVVMRRRE